MDGDLKTRNAKEIQTQNWTIKLSLIKPNKDSNGTIGAAQPGF